MSNQTVKFKTIAHYLEHYAEPLVREETVHVLTEFDTIIVIPIFDESENQIQQFLNFNNQTNTLMVWVFNVPDTQTGQSSHLRTKAVFNALLAQLEGQKIGEQLWQAEIHESLSVLLLDRCHDVLIPAKQGVGLARKLGMDLALKLILDQFERTGKQVQWVHSTDADVDLPPDYGVIPEQDSWVSACVYPFKHLPEEQYFRAMQEYEFSLHYYVQSLKAAGSPYAFHTIGSLIAVSAVAYAQVRGMPKRAGAEDFYLLNKLQKVGEVKSLTSPCIAIAGRPSQRVPFGTGPALLKIQALHEKHGEYRVYHPRVFKILKQVLDCVALIEHISSDEDVLFSALEVKLRDADEFRAVRTIFESFSWHKQRDHLGQQKTPERLRSAFHTWFDGFLTLRFIHELRDRLYPNIEISRLPAILLKEPIIGVDVDYSEWFDVLGISG